MHARRDAVRDEGLGGTITTWRAAGGGWRVGKADRDPFPPATRHPPPAARWEGGWYVTFGHVNNAVYFTYFEWARTSMWLELTGGSRSTDVSFIVARAECDFRHQLSMETIEIRVRIGDMRTTSFDTHYENPTGEWRATCCNGEGCGGAVRLEDPGEDADHDELHQTVRLFQKGSGVT